MAKVIENVEGKAAALRDLKGHPMHLRSKVVGARRTIIYPAGTFPVDGIRCDDTTTGLRRALEIMERHWRGSFPAAT